MKGYNEIIITPKDLSNKAVLVKEIVIERKDEIVVSGIVFDDKCEPIYRAIIEITKLEVINNEIKEEGIGYVTTNQEGKYAFCIEKDSLVDYRLDVYRPLFKA